MVMKVLMVMVMVMAMLMMVALIVKATTITHIIFSPYRPHSGCRENACTKKCCGSKFSLRVVSYACLCVR